MFTLSATIVALCALAALVAGFIDAIAGGGGLITLPALLLAGVPPHFTLGSNKFSSTLGTLVALGNFARSHLVQWRMALWGLGFSLAGAWAGSLLTLYFDAAQLGKVLVALLPFGMAATLVPRKERPGGERPLCGWRYWFLLPATCFVIGAYDGFFGPATGSFLILAFHWILGTSLLAASATAKVLNLASNFAAACVFIWSGKVLWPLALTMAVASMTGNWLGSRMAIRIGPAVVRRFLVFSLALLLITLVWRYFLSPGT